MKFGLRQFLWLAVACVFSSCQSDSLIDTNESLAGSTWGYHQPAKATITVLDSAVAYNIYFKLRHRAAYPYANQYVLLRIKGPGVNRTTRYQFQLADKDGAWRGKGSGDVFASVFPLLTEFRFPRKGQYSLEIQQNMRNNPLTGVSDVGIRINPKK